MKDRLRYIFDIHHTLFCNQVFFCSVFLGLAVLSQAKLVCFFCVCVILLSLLEESQEVLRQNFFVSYLDFIHFLRSDYVCNRYFTVLHV